jgi:hypothetical protein
LLEALRENFDLTIDLKLDNILEVYSPMLKCVTNASNPKKASSHFMALRKKQGGSRRSKNMFQVKADK